jgi:ribokinase
MARSNAANIVVLGSLNVDLIAQVTHLPTAGETVLASKLEKRFGGKGGNQALAAARQGAQVNIIACLGDDPEGRDYRNHLRRENINCSSLSTIRGSTGSAFIGVDSQGENQIVVIPGANTALTAPSVKMQRSRIAVSKAMLVQMEIPLDTVLAAIGIANETSVPAILNASPIRADFPWGEVTIDVLIVNEKEAAQIFGVTDPVGIQGQLSSKGIRQLIITRGSKSTLCLSKITLSEAPTHPITPVDTTGAGDAFAGAFTAHFAEGVSINESVKWANVAAALSTLQLGAQEGMPHRGDVQSAMTRQAMDQA